MNRNFFLFLFLIIWFLPPLFTFFRFDSYTYTTIVSVLLYLSLRFLTKKSIKIGKTFLLFLVLSTVILSVNILTAYLRFNDDYDIARAIVSFVFFIIFILSAFFFSKDMLNIEREYLDIFFKKLLYVYFFIIILSFFFTPFTSYYKQPVFPYNEPSHFSLFFAPILCYNILISSRQKRIILIAVGVVLALIIKNLTLLASILVISIFVYSVYALPLITLGSLMIFYFVNIQYFVDRLDFSGESTNLSTLVYMKGFELMKEAMFKSNGLGIGFQQLGYVELTTPSREMIMEIQGGDLNSKDGGFLAVKLITELGVIGVLMIILYLKLFISKWFKFRKINMNEMSAVQLIFYSSLITFFVQLFIRGLGYFTPSVFLFIVSILLIKKEKNCINTSMQNEIS